MEPSEAPLTVVGWSPDGALRILDQRRLPGEVVTLDLRTTDEVCEAIRTLAVRGAPAIGVAAAIGLVAATEDQPLPTIESAAAALRATRPTAVNLGWALDRVLAVARACADHDPRVRSASMHAEAERIRVEDERMCALMGAHGATLITDGMRILTHCNAGALATAGIGTALAPVYIARSQGKRVRVFADETRPLLQGARLTAWELARAGIPVTVCADSMAASLMARGEVDLVLVGADRIAANGDTANKVGTYGLAILAKYHGIPFVVVAPMSTVDPETRDGAGIPIEQRSASEVTHLGGQRIVAEGAGTWNPAFDVTPHTLIARIVTDKGVFAPPYAFARDASILPPPA